MTTSLIPEEPLHEKELAQRLQVERDLLKKIRAPGGPMVPGTDWLDVPGRGIIIAVSGIKKIEAALRLTAAPAADPDAPRDITIHRLCRNPRVVEGVPGEGETRVLVRLNRGPSPHYRRGMVLRGCLPLPADQQWQYPGPLPRRNGFPSV